MNTTYRSEYINLPFADCMSSSLEHRTLTSGNSYDLKLGPRMSAREGQLMEASEPPTSEQGDEALTEFSRNSFEERIEVNLEPLHAHISTLTIR